MVICALGCTLYVADIAQPGLSVFFVVSFYLSLLLYSEFLNATHVASTDSDKYFMEYHCFHYTLSQK